MSILRALVNFDSDRLVCLFLLLVGDLELGNASNLRALHSFDQAVLLQDEAIIRLPKRPSGDFDVDVLLLVSTQVAQSIRSKRQAFNTD